MTIRISEAGLDALADLAEDYGQSRSDITRTMIGYGLEHREEVLGPPPAEPAVSGAA